MNKYQQDIINDYESVQSIMTPKDYIISKIPSGFVHMTTVKEMCIIIDYDIAFAYECVYIAKFNRVRSFKGMCRKYQEHIPTSDIRKLHLTLTLLS